MAFKELFLLDFFLHSITKQMLSWFNEVLAKNLMDVDKDIKMS